MSVRPNKFYGYSSYEAQPAVRPRCKECGHKIRGTNHAEGDAHLAGLARRSSNKAK